MGKIYTALGLMSGTSMDGVDASIIRTDGNTEYSIILDEYFEYGPDIRKNLINLRSKVLEPNDLKNHSEEIKLLERELTIFHAEAVNNILSESKYEVDFLGFHGQTIFHDSDKKLTKQIGDGKLLSQMTKKIVVYDFRQNDIKNGGEGAPLASIYHKLLISNNNQKKKIKLPVTILNIGGIANITTINKNYDIFSRDIGPGNCMIDQWISSNSDNKFDNNGDISKSGKIDKFILDQFLDNFFTKKDNYKRSLDINDFDISFARGLSLKNGAATITEITAEILSKNDLENNIYVCGGGRKNKFLIKRIEDKTSKTITNIDSLGINGSFIESQAFAYLAIRSYLKLPLSFPNTTGCENPCTGGVIVENF